MPLWKCIGCHHEWEGSKYLDKCDWCGADGYIVQSETPFEKLVERLSLDKRKKKKTNI